MARKLVASLFVFGLIAAVGCHAEFQAGSGQPTAPSAPAPTTPAPPATPVATPTPTPTTPPPAPPTSTVKQEGNKLKMPGAIVFETGKAALKPESEPVLEQLKLFLDEKKHISLVRIEGHTDNVGTPEANRVLSERRAQSVMEALVQRGVDRARMSAAGFGQERPIADNRTEEGRAKNRRVELVRQ